MSRTPVEIEAEFAAFAEEISHVDPPATPLINPMRFTILTNWKRR
jgi:hypothetical protein